MRKQFAVADTDRVFTAAHFAEPWNDCLVPVGDRATLTADVEWGCERVLPPGAPILRFAIEGHYHPHPLGWCFTAIGE